ncbi:class I SAM-dependent methyltransferase [Clostridium sp. P21]|uniref:Class I SAM-dependent methyltransferase n=1 Tax=Clostridium muellerianum TaxID=2716538 RepID=A0A7Y0EG22_9CLOT|nr:class I SAM-dependent methyltransferase [Clostridium muellerianum]NMM62773.1 class I SAM-dependent methyltransferase [Clostridium muellerianum]
MKKEIYLNMKNEIFKGNVLDIGFENSGIIYNICKEENEEINIDYVTGKEEETNIRDNFYDICILFFSFSSIWFKMNKKSFIKDIYNYLNKEGILYVWDIDKGYKKIFNGNINVTTPGDKVKKIKIRDLNIFKDNSKDNTVKILENYFNVIEGTVSDGVYYIKAKKKDIIKGDISKEKNIQEGNEEKDESTINSA